jgi:O-succinylbenzoate synthase
MVGKRMSGVAGRAELAPLPRLSGRTCRDANREAEQARLYRWKGRKSGAEASHVASGKRNAAYGSVRSAKAR